MLRTLHIENIAVVKSADIELGEGFNVLTGETGAGKSVIIDSINMLTGAKVSRDVIRSGESFALSEAVLTVLRTRSLHVFQSSVSIARTGRPLLPAK